MFTNFEIRVIVKMKFNFSNFVDKPIYFKRMRRKSHYFSRINK